MTALGDFTAGDVLQAADLNAIGTWTNYTPTFSGFTGSIATAQYCRINKIVFVTMDIQITAVSGYMQVTLPIAAVHPYELNQGYGYALDAGSNIYWLRTTYGSSTQVYPSAMYTGGSYVSYSTCGPTTPFTWASGDYFNLAISYEVA